MTRLEPRAEQQRVLRHLGDVGGGLERVDLEWLHLGQAARDELGHTPGDVWLQRRRHAHGHQAAPGTQGSGAGHEGRAGIVERSSHDHDAAERALVAARITPGQ